MVQTQSIFNSINHYESYYKGKRSERQKYMMVTAIARFIEFNNLENPNHYLLYLIVDKALNIIKWRAENDIISSLEEELQKDIHLFERLESLDTIKDNMWYIEKYNLV